MIAVLNKAAVQCWLTVLLTVKTDFCIKITEFHLFFWLQTLAGHQHACQIDKIQY